jgi:uncharacterized protein YbaA (DUF1428 family)
MPFDGRRMIIGGFDPIVETGDRSRMGYADGYLLAVPDQNKDAYQRIASEAAKVFRDHGASRVVEAWGVDIPAGKVTDYQNALKMKAGESAVYSWIEWPSKEARDAGMKGAMADERMKVDPASMPFDGQRMIFGGFIPILDA